MKRILLLSLSLILLLSVSAFAQQGPAAATDNPDPTAQANSAVADRTDLYGEQRVGRSRHHAYDVALEYGQHLVGDLDHR
jgi:hypothetical protein